MSEVRIGLVLGAGGTAGAHWIRGCLAGLNQICGFRPEHASLLVGTSVGAIKAAGFGPHVPAPADVAARLGELASVPPRVERIDRLATKLRLAGGCFLAVVSRSAGPNPLAWVEAIHPETRALVCSMRRLPPRRRVADLAAPSAPALEIAASAAIPFGSRSVWVGGARHVDGAVWSVTNADVASPQNLELLIVIAPLVATDGGTAVARLGRAQLATELEPWRQANKPVLVLAPSGSQYASRQNHSGHKADALALVMAAWTDQDSGTSRV